MIETLTGIHFSGLWECRIVSFGPGIPGKIEKAFACASGRIVKFFRRLYEKSRACLTAKSWSSRAWALRTSSKTPYGFIGWCRARRRKIDATQSAAQGRYSQTAAQRRARASRQQLWIHEKCYIEGSSRISIVLNCHVEDWHWLPNLIWIQKPND